ncbi:hypothetical protein ONZ45_g15643 [Pleurotus djamor]|nr:hypothetical protein ONZ45_g15643 [Pleurotus djamor]
MTTDSLVQCAKKRLIVCCDGTGQADSHGKQVVPSNVARFARALQVSEKIPANEAENRLHDEEVQQVVLYQTGIGTDTTASLSGAIAGKTAEAFGYGLDIHVLEAYYFFVNNFESLDEIYIFGFSRGAFTARAISSFICHVGLLKKQYVDYLPVIYEAYKKRREDDEGRKYWRDWLKKHESILNDKIHPAGVTISILGVWDTVGSLGIPETWASSYLGWTGVRENWNEYFAYHDMSIPRHSSRRRKFDRPYVNSAFQALALDEHRMSFSPTLFYDPTPVQEQASSDATLQQCWFPGVHSDIGGSYERGYLDISDLALAWMIDRCSPTLAFDRKALSVWIKEPSSEFKDGELDQRVPLRNRNNEPLVDQHWGLSRLHDSFLGHFKYAGSRVRTPGQYFLGKYRDEAKTRPYITNEFIHPCVRVRLMANKRPPKDPYAWEPYLPPSMKGFVLKPHRDEAGDGWKWVKDVEVEGQKYTVELREHKIHRGFGYLEEELLTEEAKEWIDDPEADKKFDPIADDEPKTWAQTVRGWLPF